MASDFRRVFPYVFGDPKSNPLEQRLFHVITLLFGIANIGGALNFLDFERYGVFLCIVHIVVGMLYLGFFFISRTQGHFRIFYWPFVILMAAFLALSALQDGGSLGGTIYYFILAIIVATILAGRRMFVVLAGLMLTVSAVAVFYLEITMPEYVTPFPGSEHERLLEVGSQLVFIMIFTALIVHVLADSFSEERHKSDRLLLNILPESIAKELRVNDEVEPHDYRSASVLFTDFVGFTRIAEGLTPHQLIDKLDCAFRSFDRIMRRNGMEKIKTIGDSYMAVGGVPESNRTHAVDAVLAALEIRAYMEEERARASQAGEGCWELRLGIHSGELVAGVIGTEKFAYDVWGDTVNTASRLESTGEPGCVNISEATYTLVADYFECVFRGKVEVKNKDPISMYFVNGLKPEYRDHNGHPNAAFREAYSRMQDGTMQLRADA